MLMLSLLMAESAQAFPNLQVPSLTKAVRRQQAKTARYADAAAQNIAGNPKNVERAKDKTKRDSKSSGEEAGASIPNEVFNLVKVRTRTVQLSCLDVPCVTSCRTSYVPLIPHATFHHSDT
jgi:hypothetical protein